MTDKQRLSSSEYYQPFEVPGLIEKANREREKKGEAPLTVSTFYRRVEKGMIGSSPPNRQKRQKAEGYKKADVDAFLRGELGVSRRVKRQSGVHNGRVVQQRGRDLPTIDVVYPDDLPALGYMEAEQLGWRGAVGASVILSWLQKNDHLYWMQYNPKNRRGIDGVLAVLGVLPLQDALVKRLLSKEVSPQDVTVEDVLAYEQGQSYTCVIVSTTVRPGYVSVLRPLLQHVLAYWCENSIEVSQLYVLGEGTGVGTSVEAGGETSVMRLVGDSFFSPLEETSGPDGSMVWSLSFSRYNPSLFVQEYQKCIKRKKEMERLEKTHMNMSTAVLEDSTQAILPIERELGGLIKRKLRDFDRLDRRLYKVDANGRLDATRLKEVVLFRRVQSDDDIRASLRINASLFGDGKKFTEDELVAQRRAWLAVNPDIYRVLEIDGGVVGFISAFPLPMPTIDRILRGEIRMGDVPLEELQKFEPGEPVSVYLQTTGVHKKYQGLAKRQLGIFMSSGYRDLVNGLGRRGVEIDAIYTRSDEPDGINMCYGMGFQKVPPIPGVEKLVLKLDFLRHDLPFLFEYQRALELYRARQSAHAIRGADR